VSIGFENWGVIGPKGSADRGTEHRIDGVIPGIFIYLYTNQSISEKSPSWKLFSSHFPVNYRIYNNISRRPHNFPISKSGDCDPRIDAYTCDVLHWLPISQRMLYLIADLVLLCCVLCCAPSYLCDFCRPVSDVAALRSATGGQLLVPQSFLLIMQRCAFFVVDPSILFYNDLPLELHSLLVIHLSNFKKSLESLFFIHDWAGSASELFLEGALYTECINLNLQ